MSKISLDDQRKFQVPPGGEWFYNQQPMLEILRESGGLAIVWDKPNGKKMYGVYSQSKDLFMQNLLDTPVASRHAYELLVEDVPCKGYADVEWEGDPDPDHTTLQRLVAAIRTKVHEEYSHEPRIYVCCGTRPTKENPDILKHSYHIVLDNIIYERNNDGQMKQFFTTIPGFTWMDGVEEKQMIDSRVYTKNRNFRLPHCTKAGSTIPLLRISGDPLKDEFKHDFARDVPAILPFFISNPEIKDDCKFIETPPQVLQQAAKGISHKRAKTADSFDGPAPSKLFPVPIQVVQHLLATAGDTVSTLSAIQYLPAEDQWKIQGDHRAQGRKCLLKPGVTHTSNNALLFVDRVDTGFRVHYQCMSAECAKCAKPILGYISINQQTFEWQIALTSQSADNDSMQEDLPPEQESSDEMEEDNPAPEPEDSAESDHEMPDDDRPQVEVVEPPHDPENPALNTYEMVKARFEKTCFKVMNPHCYARIHKNDPEPCYHSWMDLKHFYSNLHYWGTDKHGELAKLPFVPEWLRDPHLRSVDRIVVDPSNKEKDVYNLWKGFDAEKLPHVHDSLVEELIKPITKHFNDVLTSGVAEHTRFLHHYLANIVKRPWQKSQVAISLYGAQGCGKGIIFEFFREKILGLHCSFQTSRPENDLFGRFANGAVNRVCIQIDEVKSLHDHADQLKDFITNPTITYEKKGKDTIVVSNFANLILTSNNANALTVSTDDRRFALFHCNSIHKGNTQYFDQLGAHLARPEVARAYYQYLMSLDLSEYPTSFQHKRPVTEYYKETQNNSIPVISRFFSALVNWECTEIPPPCCTPSREMYKHYVRFHTDGNYKFVMTEHAFGRQVRKISGIEVKKTKACNIIRLDLPTIKKYLEEINEYDEDATIPPPLA